MDISIASLERLHRHQIYPIVLLIKFKSTKQIKEVKDSRYPSDKVSAKAAKEMYEQALKLEAEYRHYINGKNICLFYIVVKSILLPPEGSFAILKFAISALKLILAYIIIFLFVFLR